MGGFLDKAAAGLVRFGFCQIQTVFESNEQGRIDRLCRELGWSIDDRRGNAVCLLFTHSTGDNRWVRIGNGDGSLVLFTCSSDAIIPMRNLPSDITAWLLRRNMGEGGIGKWGMYVDESQNASFCLMYQALDLDAQTLKWICESLTREVAGFDSGLRQVGLLR